MDYKIAPNIEIRRRAREICRAQWMRALVIPFAVSLLPWGINSGLAYAFPAIYDYIRLVLAVFVQAVVQFSLTQFALDLWNERPAGLRSLLRNLNRTPATWGIYAAKTLIPTLVFTLLNTIVSEFFSGSWILTLTWGIYMLIVIVLYVGISVLSVWLACRLSPSLTYLAIYPDESAWDCIRYGWHYSKGYALDIFCQAIALNLPVIILELVAILAFREHTVLFFLLGELPALLFSGYIALGMAGLNSHLISCNQTINPNEEDKQNE